eukprot:6816117-Prymnesium_polylepis.1
MEQTPREGRASPKILKVNDDCSSVGSDFPGPRALQLGHRPAPARHFPVKCRLRSTFYTEVDEAASASKHLSPSTRRARPARPLAPPQLPLLFSLSRRDGRRPTRLDSPLTTGMPPRSEHSSKWNFREKFPSRPRRRSAAPRRSR